MSHWYPQINFESYPIVISYVHLSTRLLHLIHLLLIYNLPDSKYVSTWWSPLTSNNVPLDYVFCKLGHASMWHFSQIIFVVYDVHAPTPLWNFCTHRFVAWFDLQFFAPLTNFLVGNLHNIISLHSWASQEIFVHLCCLQYYSMWIHMCAFVTW